MLSKTFPVLLLTLWIPGVASADVDVAYPKSSPVRSGSAAPAVIAATVPDCASASLVTVTAGIDTVINGDTTGQPALVDVYGCEPWDERGPEEVFELQVVDDVLLSVSLDSPSADLDVFLLSDCDGDSCVAAHISEFMADLTARPEPYYLIVDGYRGDAGAFNLTLNAQPGLLSTAACDSAESVLCGDLGFNGNILDAPNLVTMADCGSYLAFGGEDWYELELPDGAEVDIDVTGFSFDAVLWLFDACGPEAECLGYADGGVSAEDETLFFANESGADMTVLLGVDATAAVTTENGDSAFDGAFNLSISCSVPAAAEETTFGDLKSLFR